MAYEGLKECMNEAIDKGRGRREINVLGAEDGGGPSYVCACVVQDSVVNKSGVEEEQYWVVSSQMCHGFLNNISNYSMQHNGGRTTALADHIQGGKRVILNGLQTPEESIRFLQYLMDHPIIGKSFLEHDAAKAYEERIMIRDLGSLPSNVTQWSITITRALWESYQNMLPRRFCKLLNMGFTPDFSFILAHYFEVDDIGVIYMPTPGGGHSAIDCSYFSEKPVENDMAPKFGCLAPGTLVDGVPYYYNVYNTTSGTKQYNVYSTFEPDPVNYFGGKGSNYEFMNVLKEQQYSVDALKELEKK